MTQHHASGVRTCWHSDRLLDWNTPGDFLLIAAPPLIQTPLGVHEHLCMEEKEKKLKKPFNEQADRVGDVKWRKGVVLESLR